MQHGYFKYLVDIIGGLSDKKELLEFLYKIEFRYDFTIYLDGDRAENGKRLRVAYQEETGNLCELGSIIPCTVLEALVALSMAISELVDAPDNYDPGRWFWEMIDNLGLGDMNGKHYDEQAVIDAVGCWMARDYDKYGNGSLFPLRKKISGYKHMPIWNQACAYINERY